MKVVPAGAPVPLLNHAMEAFHWLPPPVGAVVTGAAPKAGAVTPPIARLVIAFGARCRITECGPPVIINPGGLATLTFTLAPLAHAPVMVTVRVVPVPDMPVTVTPPDTVTWLAARPVGFALKFRVN